MRGTLGHRGFRLFVVATGVSVVGSSMTLVVLPFAVLGLPGATASDIGVVLAARAVPMLALLLVGGLVADRMPRDRVLAWSSTVAAVTQGCAAVLLLTDTAHVWQLAAIEAVNGAATAFVLPAVQGLIPDLVPAGELQRANALSSAVRNTARIGGAALGGIVVAAGGAGWAMAFDAATFAAGGLLFGAIGLPRGVPRSGSRTTVLADLRDGWTEFVARQWLWRTVLGFTMINLAMAGGWFTLGPVIADGTFGPGWWGIVVAAYTAGVLVGTALMARLAFRRPLLAGVLGVLGHGPLLGVLAAGPHPAVLAGAAVAAGLGLGVFNVAWDTALQRHVPPARLSRVAAYDALGTYLALPAGQLTAGYLAAAGQPRAVVAAAAVLATAAALAMLATPGVRRLDDARERH